jgi:hypothetical protein
MIRIKRLMKVVFLACAIAWLVPMTEMRPLAQTGCRCYAQSFEYSKYHNETAYLQYLIGGFVYPRDIPYPDPAYCANYPDPEFTASECYYWAGRNLYNTSYWPCTRDSQTDDTINYAFVSYEGGNSVYVENVMYGCCSTWGIQANCPPAP